MLVNFEVKFTRLLPGNAEINCLTCQNLLHPFVKVVSWICQKGWLSLAKLGKYDAGLPLSIFYITVLAIFNDIEGQQHNDKQGCECA